MDDKEIRTKNDLTGAEKGSKLERHDLIPTEALAELATHYGVGAQKYPDADRGIPNWRRGYDWSLSYSAALRHLNAFWGGEDRDMETKSKHVIAAAWHCMSLATYMEEYPEGDDRWNTSRIVLTSSEREEVKEPSGWIQEELFDVKYFLYDDHGETPTEIEGQLSLFGEEFDSTKPLFSEDYHAALRLIKSKNVEPEEGEQPYSLRTFCSSCGYFFKTSALATSKASACPICPELDALDGHLQPENDCHE